MRFVAVTTSPDRAAAATIPFRMLGLETLVMPCIEVVPADQGVISDARDGASHADLIVITSRRTLAILWPDSLPEVPFAAVGTVTARAIQERGGTVVLTGTGGSAELASALQPVVAGMKVVWPSAVRADALPHRAVAAVAASFQAPAVYGTIPRPPGGDKVDLVSFASPSAVTGWQMTRSLEEAPIAVIGSTTRAAVEERGGSVAVVAPTPTFQSLAESVAEYLGVSA